MSAVEIGLRIRHFLLSALIAATLAGCSRSDISGHYVARFSNGVYGLQLVETPDRHLTGQLDTVILNQNNKLEYTSFTATGVEDRGSVSLSFKQSGLLGAQLSGSGTMDGTSLSLTGNVNPGKVSTVNFTRASDQQYKTAINDLISAASNAAAQKAEADARNALIAKQNAFSGAGQNLVGRLQRFNSDADVHLARWPHTQEMYRQITAKMDSYLGMERQLVGNPNAAVKRGQIAVEINQVSLSTDQLHYDVMSVQNDFQTNISPLRDYIQKAKISCESHNAITTSPKGAEACQDIARLSEPFQAKYAAFATGLVQLEQVYRTEHEKQDQLVRESERLE